MGARVRGILESEWEKVSTMKAGYWGVGAKKCEK